MSHKASKVRKRILQIMPSSPREPKSASEIFTEIVIRERNPLWSWVIAVAAVGVTLVLDQLFRDVLSSHNSFIPLAAVAVTAICSGYGPGLFAAALAILGLFHFFWAPAEGQWSALGVAAPFALTAFMVAWGAGKLRSLYKTSLQSAAALQAAVDERNELLSLLSQDFRTHLSTLRLNQGVLRMLMQSVSPTINEGFLQRFNLADRQISRLTTLIDNVIEVSEGKISNQSVNREEFDLSTLAREIAESMSLQAEQANCKLNVDLRPALGKWDHFRLERVILNLLANAISFAPGTEIALRTFTADGHAKLIVEDHGPGIPEDRLRTIFQFPDQPQHHLGKDGGLGLGLFVAKRIVEAHGGKIDATSRIGRGSKFTIDLPLGSTDSVNCPP
jgi:signal transduction histidine kinase